MVKELNWGFQGPEWDVFYGIKNERAILFDDRKFLKDLYVTLITFLYVDLF